jgi:hypothetical protein
MTPASPAIQPVAPGPGAVASPCIDICQIVAETGLCRGCGRTLDEIAAWPAASDEERRAILRRIDRRRAESSC